MLVDADDIRGGIHELGLAGKPVCLHSSLRSFGRIDGGAPTIVDAFLHEECTLLVPAFSWIHAVPPPPALQFERNAADYDYLSHTGTQVDRVFNPETSTEIDPHMGAVSREVVTRTDSRRGNHPICSFAAVGPLASPLVEEQGADDVYAPLNVLAREGGFVLLAGVDLTKMTLIHLSEKEAGRVLFRRWANGLDNQPMAVEAGGCSDGFLKLAPVLSGFVSEQRIGASLWHAYPASDALVATTQAILILADPLVTHCGDRACGRCHDAVAGGPILGCPLPPTPSTYPILDGTRFCQEKQADPTGESWGSQSGFLLAVADALAGNCHTPIEP